MISHARRFVGVWVAIATFAVARSSAGVEAAPPPAPVQAAPVPPPQGFWRAEQNARPPDALFTNVFIGAGAGAVMGLGPGFTGMTAISVGVRRSSFVFLFETQILWGAWSQPMEATRFEWNGVLVPMALCYERRGWMGCGVHASALLEAKGYRGDRALTSTMTYSAENRTWFSTVGVRAGYELRLTTSFYVRGHIDVLKTISQPNVHGGGAPIWQVSSLVGSAGIHLFYTWGYDHGRKALFD